MADHVNSKKGGSATAGDGHAVQPVRAHARGSVVAYFNREPAHPSSGAAADSSRGDPAADSVVSEVIYPEDVDDWAARLEVTREQLQAAIRRVGARVDDVARYLANPDVV